MKSKTIAKVASYILVVLLLVLIAGLAYKYLSGSEDDDSVTGVELDVTEIVFTGTDVSVSDDGNGSTSSEYSVQYLITGDATNLSDITVSGTDKAAKGETVMFTVTINEDDYYLSEMRISVSNSTESPEITETDGVYSFTMPQGNTIVWIYFAYSPEVAETEKYAIEYDTLGWGSVLSVDVDCPSYAEAGQTVTFTAAIKSEYAAELKISGITVELSGAAYIEDLQPVDGSYTFTMPSEETLSALSDPYITLMLYVIPVDM